jgi:hypothetical protein
LTKWSALSLFGKTFSVPDEPVGDRQSNKQTIRGVIVNFVDLLARAISGHVASSAKCSLRPRGVRPLADRNFPSQNHKKTFAWSLPTVPYHRSCLLVAVFRMPFAVARRRSVLATVRCFAISSRISFGRLFMKYPHIKFHQIAGRSVGAYCSTYSGSK